MLEAILTSSQPLSPVASSNSGSSSSHPQQDERWGRTCRRWQQRRRSPGRISLLMLSLFALFSIQCFVPGSRYAAHAEDGAGDDQAAAGDDANAAAAAAANNDDGGNNNNEQVDDGGKSYADDNYNTAKVDASQWNWASGTGFSGVQIMPISCINFNNGHMIKFELFESETSYQCHFARIGTWVVSIAHFMRAYFNYQALISGRDFKLPGDAGYLNCIMLQETAYSDMPLYAKIGCVDRETFTSTKLQLHVYTDSQCSYPYNDGKSNKYHAIRGYEINGYTFSTHVSFRPSFYSCDSCEPEQIAETFNKKNGNWYDDDYISQHGKKESNNNNNNNQDNSNNDNSNANGQEYTDDYFSDEQYLAANDDVNGNNNQNNNDQQANDDGGKNNDNNNNNQNNDDGGKAAAGYSFDDDYFNDDARRHKRQLTEAVGATAPKKFTAKPGLLEAYHSQFWQEFDKLHRSLYDNYYDIGDWNFCQRLYKYGVWCDAECRALDVFRTDKWSKPDVFLLAVMCTFFTAMLLLIVAKRLKAAEKARIYGRDQPLPGLPPLAMAVIFLLAIAVVVTMGLLKFVNETLVFAVVTCILLFIYMLKLTLFEQRRPVLLATPQHDLFDNPLDDKLFD